MSVQKCGKIIYSAMMLNIRQIRNISLKWKLLTPFFFLPAALTIILVAWGIYSQNQILTVQEENRLRHNFRQFEQRIKLRLNVSMSLAAMVASDPAAQKVLAEKDREALKKRYLPIYEQIDAFMGIKQFHFHIRPGVSFLRLHRLDQFGDELASYRRTITTAYKTGILTGGLEYGVTGLGIRGVAPIYHEGRIVGSVECGWGVGQVFLNQLKKDMDCDLTIYIASSSDPSKFTILATTSPYRTYFADRIYADVYKEGRTVFMTVEKEGDFLALLAGPLRDFQGKNVAVVEMSRDRTGTLFLIRRYGFLIVVLGISALALAMLFVWCVSNLFLAPVGALTEQAEKIADGKRVPKMEVTAKDEFGSLARALNRMLSALEKSRRRIENHAHELEAKVTARTAELVRSEEKFRTLVENIPLVVYRLERDLTNSFISPHIEKLTGWPSEKAVGGPEVWGELIHPKHLGQVLEQKKRCLISGDLFEMEYQLLDVEGDEVPVLDRAVPVTSESGRIMYFEGYLLDLRERRRLEDKTRQAEELKTLSEISARLAHEFRNPLTVVGACASRLVKGIDTGDPGARHAQIIIEEVAHLEKILKMILAYIKQVRPTLQKTAAGPFLEDIARSVRPILDQRQIDLRLKLEKNLPILDIDPDMMGRALKNLIRNAAFQMALKSKMKLLAQAEADTLEIKLLYPAGYLADDQLRHFFYPFTTEDADTSLVELPLVPVIIHKHNGFINIEREGADLVAVIINLPAA